MIFASFESALNGLSNDAKIITIRSIFTFQMNQSKIFNILLNFDDFGALEGAKIIKIQQNIENFIVRN